MTRSVVPERSIPSSDASPETATPAATAAARTDSVAFALAILGAATGVQGNHEQAQAPLTEAHTTPHAAGESGGSRWRSQAHPASARRPEHDTCIADIRALLDEAAFAEAWADGRAMRLDEAVAYALDQEPGD